MICVVCQIETGQEENHKDLQECIRALKDRNYKLTFFVNEIKGIYEAHKRYAAPGSAMEFAFNMIEACLENCGDR